MSASKKILLDSVHGTIYLDSIIFRVIDMPEFQRLRHIHQLETINYLYPSACHTRFEHSVGTCYLAGEIIEHLQLYQPEMGIDSKDVLCVKLGALCHDLGHGPFSHLFEELIKRIHMAKNPNISSSDAKKFFQHELASLAIFDRIFEKLRLTKEFKDADLNNKDREFIKELIKPTIVPKIDKIICELQTVTNKRTAKHLEKKIEDLNRELQNKCGRNKEKSFLFEIVSNWRNQIDVDKWDYFARDAKHLGINITFDPKRFIYNCRIIKPDENGLNQICVRDKELRNVYEMFRTREDLYRRAYQHSKSVGIKEITIDILLHLDKAFGYYDIAKDVTNRLDFYLSLDDRVLYSTNRILVNHMNLNQNQLDSLAMADHLVMRLETRRHYQFIDRNIISNKELTTKAAKKELMRSFSGLSDEDIAITELRVNFGDGDRDPLDKLKFFEKNTFRIVNKEDIPDYKSEMRPKTFQEVYWNLYLKNEQLCEDKNFALSLRTRFKELCAA